MRKPEDAGTLGGDVKWTALKIGVGSEDVAPFVLRQVASGPGRPQQVASSCCLA